MNFRLRIPTLLLILATLACGGVNSPSLVSTQPADVHPSPTPVRPYALGDVIQYRDHTLALTAASISGEELRTSFTVTNTGSRDLNVISGFNFDARLPDGTRLPREYFQCPPAQLDGRVLPGESLKGNLCWHGVTGDVVRIYYIANVLDPGATVWEIRR